MPTKAVVRFVAAAAASVIALPAVAEDAAPCPTVEREHRGKVVARAGKTTITVCDVSEALGKMSPYLRKAYASEEKLLRFVDNMVRFELIAAEAWRKGLDQDPEVVRTSRQMMVQRLSLIHI